MLTNANIGVRGISEATLEAPFLRWEEIHDQQLEDSRGIKTVTLLDVFVSESYRLHTHILSPSLFDMSSASKVQSQKIFEKLKTKPANKVD